MKLGRLAASASLAAMLACRAAAPPAAIPAAALPPVDAAVLVGAGDVADCGSSDDERTAGLVRALLAERPQARVFVAGDNAYPTGSLDEYQRCYLPSWGAFRDRTIAAAGNHDWLTKDAAGFRQTFCVGAGEPLYRGDDVGSWRVLAVDSDCGAEGACEAGSAQLAWLADELSRNQQRCTLVIAHHPRFSSGHHGASPSHQPLWEAMVAGGADVVINGHDHHYERIAPLDASGAPSTRGLRTFIAGTGGRMPYELRDPVAGSEARLAGRAGVLVLTLEPGHLRYAFVTVDGEIGDQGDAPCVGDPVAIASNSNELRP